MRAISEGFIMKAKQISLFLAGALLMSNAALAESSYTGTARGFGGDVTAEVGLDDAGKVVSLTVTADSKTPTVGGAAIEPLVAAILEKGDADVDGIAGATITSNAVLSIVKDAIAGGAVDYSNVEITYTPGTYTGTAHGRNGDVSVEVTFSAYKIESINVLENSETPGVSDLPQKQIPEDILTYQSLDVDGITGAPLTSNAILAAVADAAQQAGANVNALRAVPVDKPVAPVQDLTTQVVVVGAGSAGLTAASKAADEGAQVVLVEKMPYVGGSLLLSAGGHATATANEFGKQNNVTVDLADTMDWVRTANATASHQPDYDFIEYLLSQTGETMDYYTQELGMQGSMTQQNATRRYGNTLLGGSRFGAGVVDALAAHLAEKGVTVVLDATANEIVMEDGKAVGIKATAPGGDFTVRADKVILATGGANYNSELMTSVTPSMNYMTIDHQPLVGNTGDGWAMLRAVNAKEGDGPFLKPASAPSYAGVFGYTWQNTPNLNSQLIFDANGVRYVREDQGVELNMSSGLAVEMLRHGSPASYALFDAHNIREDFLAKLKEQPDNPNVVVYGKNIEEIAEKLGIDAKVLSDTYNRYQHLCEVGEDTNYGKDPRFLVPYNDDEGLYAAFIQPGSYGTIGGFLTGRQFHVLDQNDQAIENLFAIGELSTSELFGDYYMGAFSLGYYATEGRIAAETAVSEINAAK